MLPSSPDLSSRASIHLSVAETDQAWSALVSTESQSIGDADGHFTRMATTCLHGRTDRHDPAGTASSDLELDSEDTDAHAQVGVGERARPRCLLILSGWLAGWLAGVTIS